MPTFGPSGAKPKPLSPGTEGSNPALSSGESAANSTQHRQNAEKQTCEEQKQEGALEELRGSGDEAVRAARGLSEFGVYWLEEPTIPDDVEGHRRIVRDGGVPIASGENLHTLYEFKQMIFRAGLPFPSLM